MKTLILSSSLSKNSRSYILCKYVKEELNAKGDNITFVDARNIPMQPVHRGGTPEMETFSKQVEEAEKTLIMKRFVMGNQNMLVQI